MKFIAIVQARMASQRLPQKVMRDLGGKKTIDWVAEAASRAAGKENMVVATSVNPENDVLAQYCESHGYQVVRGSEDDVLDRYLKVINLYQPDAVIRLTADCPLMDSRVIAELMALHEATGADYTTNTDPPTYPDGLDVEVISTAALWQANKEATRKTDRDTVTQYIVRNRHKFSTQNMTCPVPGLHKERWVLDSPEDMQFMEEVFSRAASGWVPNYPGILALLNANPRIRDLNSKYSRNERHFEALVAEEPLPRDHVISKNMLTDAEARIPLGAQTFSKSKLQYPQEAPLFATHGDGGRIYDVDGNEYVDLVGGLLPNILGYRDPDVDRAIRQQLDAGISLSLSTELELKLANKLAELIPCAEMSRFAKNGNDVTSAAVRLARLATRRLKILSSGYHGWADWTVVNDPVRNGGVLYNVRETTTILEHGSMMMAQHYLMTGEYACVIVEPETDPEWLKLLRELCDKTGTVLIFDEIITGFRLSMGGAQELYGVTPDLSCFGKAMGNGMPMNALVGKRQFMQHMNDICFSGTFFGESLSLAASLATIEKMEKENVLGSIHKKNGIMLNEINKMMEGRPKFLSLSGMEFQRINFHAVGAYTKEEIKTAFMQQMIANGVLVIGSHNFCYAHSDYDMARILNAYTNTIAFIHDAIQQGNLCEKTQGQVIPAHANVRVLN